MSGFYTEGILNPIFSLSEKFIQAGYIHKAEVLLRGTVAVAPDFAPGWLGLSYCSAVTDDNESALIYARRALKLEAKSPNAMLAVITHLISLKELQEAGTLLGEMHDEFQKSPPQTNLKRYFELQILRFDQVRNRN